MRASGLLYRKDRPWQSFQGHRYITLMRCFSPVIWQYLCLGQLLYRALRQRSLFDSSGTEKALMEAWSDLGLAWS